MKADKEHPQKSITSPTRFNGCSADDLVSSTDLAIGTTTQASAKEFSRDSLSASGINLSGSIAPLKQVTIGGRHSQGLSCLKVPGITGYLIVC